MTYLSDTQLRNEARALLRDAKRMHGRGTTLARKGYDVEPCYQGTGHEYLRVTIWILRPDTGKIDSFVGLV